MVVAVRAALAAGVAVARVRPQRSVHDETEPLESGDGLGHTTGGVLLVQLVARLVVDEAPRHPVAEGRVGPGVQDEGVPPDVDER